MSGEERTELMLWLVGPAFLGVTALLVLASPEVNIPIDGMNVIPREAIRAGAWRVAKVNAVGLVAGSDRACTECHALFTTPPGENKALVQHKDVVMNHGMNSRCLNCHDGDNRDKLVLHDGTQVAFTDTPRLCSQCHGTVYRDWQAGTHGKTLGSWDAGNEEHRRLTCNECHEPHSPAYKPMSPLPGPRTLRMGDQSFPAVPHGKRLPLRQWSTPHTPLAPHAPAASEEPGEKTPESGGGGGS